jgi:serine/threonine protein kinase HipA of HipAB toxin-antitoxin module
MPSLAACAELIRRYSTQPAVDLCHFVGWIFFNFYAGNNDSHAKNLSLYNLPGKGVTLTPFYDLMCAPMYPGLSQGRVRNRRRVQAGITDQDASDPFGAATRHAAAVPRPASCRRGAQNARRIRSGG